MAARKEYDITKAIEEIVTLFGPLTNEQRIYLTENITLRTYSKGEILYEESDSPKYMMCLLRGKVMIAKNGIGNRSQIIRLINEKGFSAIVRHLPVKTTALQPLHTRSHSWGLFPLMW